jgi:RNA polymerase sigma-70 factor (ECF subfamily)
MPGRQPPDIALLVHQARQGDKQAFGELYELYAPRVYRFFAAHLDNNQDAEDLTGEVFIKVWRALPGYRERGVPFGGYLFRIARNALIDQYRRSGRKSNPLPIDETRLPDPDANPAQLLGASLERRQIRQKLAQLKEDYRTVLTLRFLSDLSPDEVAVAMSRSPGAVRVLQHRALAALRKLLSEQD